MSRVRRILPALLVSSSLMATPALAVDQGQLIGLGVGLGVAALGKMLQGGGNILGGDNGKKAERKPSGSMPGSQTSSKPSKRKPSSEVQEATATPDPMPVDHLGNLVLPRPRPPELADGFADNSEFAADNPPMEEAKINLWDDAPAEGADANTVTADGAEAGQGEPVAVVIGKPASDASASDQPVEVSSFGDQASQPVAVTIGKPASAPDAVASDAQPIEPNTEQPVAVVIGKPVSASSVAADAPQTVNAASTEPVAVQIGTPAPANANVAPATSNPVSVTTGEATDAVTVTAPNMARHDVAGRKEGNSLIVVPKISGSGPIEVKIGTLVSGKPQVPEAAPQVTTVDTRSSGEQPLAIKVGVPAGETAKP